MFLDAASRRFLPEEVVALRWAGIGVDRVGKDSWQVRGVAMVGGFGGSVAAVGDARRIVCPVIWPVETSRNGDRRCRETPAVMRQRLGGRRCIRTEGRKCPDS